MPEVTQFWILCTLESPLDATMHHKKQPQFSPPRRLFSLVGESLCSSFASKEGRERKERNRNRRKGGQGDMDMVMCKTHFRLVSGSVGVQDCVKRVWPREFKKGSTFLSVS